MGPQLGHEAGMPNGSGSGKFAPAVRSLLRILPLAACLAIVALPRPLHAEADAPDSRECHLGTALAEAMSRAANLDKTRERLLGTHATVPAPVIRDLVQWIGTHTDYDISTTLARPPGISFCDDGTDISYEGEEVMVDPLLRAAYDMEARRIHLVRPWHASNARDLSSLLHELIHDVQYLNRDWSCKEEPEWEAYKLQETWLAEQGMQSGFNWTQILLFSRCPRDTHP